MAQRVNRPGQQPNRPQIPPLRLDKGKNKIAEATGQAQKKKKPTLKPPKVTPAGLAAKRLVSTAGAPTVNTAAVSAEIVRVAEPGGGHTVHFPPGLLTMPVEGTSGGIHSLEQKRNRRRQIKTPLTVDSSNDEEGDGASEYRLTPPVKDKLDRGGRKASGDGPTKLRREDEGARGQWLSLFRATLPDVYTDGGRMLAAQPWNEENPNPKCLPHLREWQEKLQAPRTNWR